MQNEPKPTTLTQDYLTIPGHVPVQVAARLLGRSPGRVWQLIHSGKLPFHKIGHRYLVPEQAIHAFAKHPRGKSRTKPVHWRAYHTARVMVWRIDVCVLPGKAEAARTCLTDLALDQHHLFAGTMQRFIISAPEQPESITMLLIWKDTDTSETTLKNDLQAFQTAFADVLDWTTSSITKTQALAHT